MVAPRIVAGISYRELAELSRDKERATGEATPYLAQSGKGAGSYLAP